MAATLETRAPFLDHRVAAHAWADDLLDPSLLRRQGYLRPEPIQRLGQEHCSGRADHTPRLWTILMWQAWQAEWLIAPPPRR